MTAHSTTKLYRSIHAQPAALRALLKDWDGPSQAAKQLAQARRILIAGIGTSFHAAMIGEYMLRQSGVEAWATRSYEIVTYPRPLHADDAMIIISHRGSKLYSAQAIQRAQEAQVLAIGITGKNTKMQGASTALETVEQDPSPTHSISYTGALTRLAQIAARLATLKGKQEEALRLERGLALLPAQMEQILAHEDEIQQVAQEAAHQKRRIYFVGAGPNAATASEGALKAKEASYVTTEGFELEQAIHGPLVAFESEDLLIPISVKGSGQTRMTDFLLALSEINPHICLLGEAPNPETEALFQRDHWSRFALADSASLSDLPEELTPLLAALPVQLLADFLATARGTDADAFRLDHKVYRRANARLRL
jgi:glucosamine--fructose-6-phosphate aminotransferase (isomerizing)